MKFIFVFFAAMISPIISAVAQEFRNLDFEEAQVVLRDKTFGFLDWSLAAPGWGHSQGSDTSIVYYRFEHLGTSQVYLLVDSNSPAFAPGRQLAGKYSMSFASGTSSSSGFPSPWVQA